MLTRLAQYFRDKEYLWSTTEGPILPTEEDLRMVIDNSVERLYDEPVGSMLQVGRLCIEKADEGLFDVYVHFGEIRK